ncbi:MAG: radical SAM protein [Myxococcales bacterium]|nr:MAG: radical SAM protein [Myxococcales bacterium]
MNQCKALVRLRKSFNAMVHAQLIGEPFAGFVYSDAPRNVYWETTIACDLACKHCRANALPYRDPAELNTEQAKRLIDSVKTLGSMLVLTGGDPMKRPDLFELIAYARSHSVPVSVTPSTTPSLSSEKVAKMKELGVMALGVSLDGPNAEVHDGFRQVPGTFDYSMRALGWAKEHEIPVQINTTITRDTLPHVETLYRLLSEKAHPPVRRWSLFVLIPVGRGASNLCPAKAK